MENFKIWNRGITLVALVITIIILLILAGVTINTLTRENGLFLRAKEAKEKTEISNAMEEINLAIIEEQMRAETGENLGNIFNYENVWNALRKNDSKLKVTENIEDRNYIIVYKGYEFKIDENKNVTYVGKEDEKQQSTEYTIIYNKNDGSGEKLNQIVAKGQEITLENTKFTKGGYEIEGWYTNAECTGEKVTIVNGNIEIYAKWVEKTTLESIGSTTIGDIIYIESYEIWNKAQLEYFRNKVNEGKTFENCILKQKVDINLNSENWIPIGTPTNYFSGKYDGEQHKIEGINVNQTTGYDHGLFGYVQGTETQAAEIENLSTEGQVIGTYNVAGIVGRANYINIKNCISTVTVTSKSYGGEGLSGTGGIIGRLGSSGGIIENCKNYGTIKGNYQGIGGIVGWGREGEITKCENNVNISATTSNVGGIVGQGPRTSDTNDYIKIYECVNNNDIAGTDRIGGILGNSNFIEINNCVNNGNISASSYISQEEINSSLAGGIAGCIVYAGNSNKIINCTNNGNVSGKYAKVGGITGIMAKGNIQNCYNNGEVISNTVGYVGGIVGVAGYNYSSVQTVANISESRNNGVVKGVQSVGGIAGLVRITGKIEQCANAGDIFSTGYDSSNYANTGGIVGICGSSGDVLYSYNTGNIESVCRAIGGIVGRYNGNGTNKIQYCYNIGYISNSSTSRGGMTGGIVGVRTSGTVNTVTDCWELTNCIISGSTDNNGGITVIEKTEEEIKALNWNHFTVKEGVNQGYPILEWEIE